MGGRAWSQEELIRLEELTEKYPLVTVARILNRSENAVILRGIHNQRDYREDGPVRIKYQIQTLRKGEKRWQKLRSGRETKTKPEASC